MSEYLDIEEYKNTMSDERFSTGRALCARCQRPPGAAPGPAQVVEYAIRQLVAVRDHSTPSGGNRAPSRDDPQACKPGRAFSRVVA